MDYKRVHDSIIHRAKNRNIEGYIETHHIIPKCLGGNNKKSNLVKLTAKEHFIVHRLLTLIYPENISLIYAYWAMCGLLTNQYRKERYIPSGRAYSDAKKRMSEVMKDRLSVFNVWKDKKHSEESKKKQSISAENRNISLDSETIRRKGISDKMKLVKRTKEWKENISDSKKGDKNPMFGKTGVNHPNSKPIVQYSLDNEFIKNWDNARQAAKELGLSHSAIGQCLKGRNTTSGGYKWKYKEIKNDATP